MQITLCMIVKDEEPYIRMCLERALQAVDRAVVVDTGSSDRTLSILREFGERVEVRRYAWQEDFAAARNYSLKGVQGDWILVLDADEKWAGDPARLRQVLEQSEWEGYDIAMESCVNDGLLTARAYARLFRNRGYRYHRAVHEQTTIDYRAVTLLPVEAGKITHYGYRDCDLQGKEKVSRNLRILLAEVQACPEDAFLYYHIGTAYGALREEALSLQYYRRCLELQPTGRVPEYHYILYKKMALTYYALGRYAQGAEFAAERNRQEGCEGFVDLPYIQGLCLKQLGRQAEAAEAFRHCIQMGDNNRYPTVCGRGSFLAQLELARLYRETGAAPETVAAVYIEGVLHPKNGGRRGLREFHNYLREQGLTALARELVRLTGIQAPELEGEQSSRVRLPDDRI